MTQSIRYIASLKRVREVSLLGSANLEYWREPLAKEGLTPLQREGRAQVLIIAADATFKRMRFQEASFSVLVTPPEHSPWLDAAFLVHAFNTLKLFAFCERVFFSTPYFHADCQMSAALPVAIQIVKHHHNILFRVGMRSASLSWRKPSRSGEECWEGPIFLPTTGRAGREKRRLFFAKIQGQTQRYRFLDGDDELLIKPQPDNAILQMLVESNFDGKEWIIRDDATHAKSKTYRRPFHVPGHADI